MYPQAPQSIPTIRRRLMHYERHSMPSRVMVQARDPFRDFERDSELRTALNRKLMTLVADGVTDPVCAKWSKLSEQTTYPKWRIQPPQFPPNRRIQSRLQCRL